MRRPSQYAGFPLACLLIVLGSAAAQAQGPILSGAGPVNRSMGGASTAAPLEAIGALYWNPATIGGLPSSELAFGIEALYPHATISSSIPGGALGPGMPAGSLSGKTHDEVGVFALPSGGFVYKPECSGWTFGVGVAPTAGFGVNYPGSSSNPILSASPPNGFGLGHISTQYQLIQIAPTATYQVTERLYVGFAPLIDVARLEVNPGVFLAADDANRNASPNYPSATSTRNAFGAGFQAGVYYVASDAWRFGAAFRSPQWFEPFRYNTSDELGRARSGRFRFETPLIVSLGTAFTGVERLTVAVDVRYFNFRDTNGVQSVGFAPTGEILGLGWNDVFSAAVGAQYQVTDDLSVRAGYTYNTNMIPSRNIGFNVGAPVTYQHQLAVGASYRLTQSCVLSATYYHIFNNTITGPYGSASGTIPGASISTGASVDSLLVSASVRF